MYPGAFLDRHPDKPAIIMGGSGSGRLGVGHPELFDFVAPLGGPTDWIYLLEYIHRYHIGGFCTEAERAGGADCSAASLTHAPDRGEPLGVQKLCIRAGDRGDHALLEQLRAAGGEL